MSHGYPITQRQGASAGSVAAIVGDMQDTTILDIGRSANADSLHIPTDNRHRPDRGVRADLHIADHDCTIIDPGIVRDTGGM